MSKLLSLPVIIAVVVQLVVSFIWYHSSLFGTIITTETGKTIDLFKADTFALVLTVLSGFGVAYVLDALMTVTGVKDITGVIKLAFTVGVLLIGLLLISLLGLLGFSKIVLMVILGHAFVTVLVAGIVLLKVK